MTVGHGIGLGVGDSEAIAVVQSSQAPPVGPPMLVEPATLRVSATAATLGAPADEPGVLGGFVTRVGDAGGVTAADGTVYLAEDLLATATASLLATVTRHVPGLSPQTVVAAHPARWDAATVAALRGAYDRAGLAAVTLVPDAVAAARWFDATHGAADGLLAVCDFAAVGLTVSLVRTGGEPRLLPPTTFSPLFGGDSVDHTIAEHVLGAAAADLGPVDPTDPVVRAHLDRLRARCRAAKERLSEATEVTVPVSVGGPDVEVTLTRAEVEEMLRGPLEGALSLVEGTLAAHELDPTHVRAVLLTGGGAAIPLLSELAAALPAPAVTPPAPGLVAAHGAAILAAGGAGPMPPAGQGSPADSMSATVALAGARSGDVSPDAETDSLPAVPRPAAPTAFTEAGPGSLVLPAAPSPSAAASPSAASPFPTDAGSDPARPNRKVLAAGGVLAALVVTVLAGAAALSQPGDTAGTPLPHLDPPVESTRVVTTTRPAPTTTTTPPPPPPPVIVAPETVDPTTWVPTTTAPPVRTTVEVPPVQVTTTRPVTTTTTPAATTTTQEPAPTTTTTTVPPTTTVTDEPVPEPDPDPEPGPGIGPGTGTGSENSEGPTIS